MSASAAEEAGSADGGLSGTLRGGVHHSHLDGMLKHRLRSPAPGSDSVGLGSSPRICMSSYSH